jgi:hypothetical protein
MKKIRSPTTDFSTPVSAQLERLEGIPGILARAEAYASLASKLESALPLSMQAHVRFSSIDKQTLRFLAASSAWATKLRFLSTDMVALANRLGFHAVTSLAVRVNQRSL